MSVEPIPGLPSAGSRNEGFALTALLAVLLLLSEVVPPLKLPGAEGVQGDEPEQEPVAVAVTVELAF